MPRHLARSLLVGAATAALAATGLVGVAAQGTPPPGSADPTPAAATAVAPATTDSAAPSDPAVASPTEDPTETPTGQPSEPQVAEPTAEPSDVPTDQPSEGTGATPGDQPSQAAEDVTSGLPSHRTSGEPTPEPPASQTATPNDTQTGPLASEATVKFRLMAADGTTPVTDGDASAVWEGSGYPGDWGLSVDGNLVTLYLPAGSWSIVVQCYTGGTWWYAKQSNGTGYLSYNEADKVTVTVKAGQTVNLGNLAMADDGKPSITLDVRLPNGAVPAYEDCMGVLYLDDPTWGLSHERFIYGCDNGKVVLNHLDQGDYYLEFADLETYMGGYYKDNGDGTAQLVDTYEQASVVRVGAVGSADIVLLPVKLRVDDRATITWTVKTPDDRKTDQWYAWVEPPGGGSGKSFHAGSKGSVTLKLRPGTYTFSAYSYSDDWGGGYYLQQGSTAVLTDYIDDATLVTVTANQVLTLRTTKFNQVYALTVPVYNPAGVGAANAVTECWVDAYRYVDGDYIWAGSGECSEEGQPVVQGLRAGDYYLYVYPYNTDWVEGLYHVASGAKQADLVPFVEEATKITVPGTAIKPVVLSRAPQLSLTVQLPNGQPAAGAAVLAVNWDTWAEYDGETNAQGQVSLTVAPGEYLLVIDAPAGSQAYGGFYTVGDSGPELTWYTAEATFVYVDRDTKVGPVKLDQGHTVKVKVYTPSGVAPGNEAQSCEGYLYTDLGTVYAACENGLLTFEGVAPGALSLWIESVANEDWVAGYYYETSGTPALGQTDEAYDYVFAMGAQPLELAPVAFTMGGSIEWDLVAPDGSALVEDDWSGCMVVAYNDDGWGLEPAFAECGPNYIKGLAPGNYDLYFHYYADPSQGVTGGYWAGTGVDLAQTESGAAPVAVTGAGSATDLGTVKLMQATKLTVTVAGASAASGTCWAEASLVGTDPYFTEWAESCGSGQAELWLRPGDYRVSASSGSQASPYVTVNVPTWGGDLTTTVTLGDAATLSIAPVDSGGTSVADWYYLWATLFTSTSQFETYETAYAQQEDGTYLRGDLAPGSYYLAMLQEWDDTPYVGGFYAGDGQPLAATPAAATSLTLTAGTTTQVAPQLTTCGAISGKVTRPDPEAYYAVLVQELGGGYVGRYTNTFAADGSYTVEGLWPGNYVVRAIREVNWWEEPETVYYGTGTATPPATNNVSVTACGTTTTGIDMSLSKAPAGNSTPAVKAGQASQTGQATPPSKDGAVAAVTYQVNLANWFEDADGDPLNYQVLSFDGYGAARINASTFQYRPAVSDASKTITVEVRATDGWSYSDVVTIAITVKAVPKDTTKVLQFDSFTLSPDLTGDGLGEVLAIKHSTGVLQLFPAKAGGSLGSGSILVQEYLAEHRVFGPGDWDGDKKADVVTVDAAGNMWLRKGNAKGGVGSPVQIGRGWSNYRIIPAGDLNGDGIIDLLAIDAAGKLWLYAGNGKGAFKSGRTEVGHGWQNFTCYAAGDLNKDGKMDILGVSSAGLLYAYFGKGNGTFQAPTQVGRGWDKFTLAAGADLTGDGLA
ncbi:MAG: FG-GAP-like repeat-containing protein, partial [Bifidobacteriaceae bacterium]|nr:FG-GAP-like repeat-containing protein [Bifidobacteriaceae bacterium]